MTIPKTIEIGGKTYRRFIPHPYPVKDGTNRCFRCGQIDEPRHHDASFCLEPGDPVATHYVSRNAGAVFVKTADFFHQQGGLSQEWGRAWRPVQAASIGEARRKGAALFDMTLSPIFIGEP
jgi:hypothetical protein